MTSVNGLCSVPLIEAALNGKLPVTQEITFQEHLETCEVCIVTMEKMAGGPEWCQETAMHLTKDELDEAAQGKDDWSEVDFTVEYLEPSDEPNVLGRLGGYDMLEVIGRGGMGVVLKGFDAQLKRCVAVKVLAPHLAHNPLFRKRFAREAQAAAAVMHPNVIAIHQVQATGRLPFLVMPLIPGESLQQRLAKRGPLEVVEILRISMQASSGLAAAHEQGLVHRDVKPANILLEPGVERAVLTDFGLARAGDDRTLTQWGVIAGTPNYMSPEQARGEKIDGRSDLFSLGCVLHEMATGRTPFNAEGTLALLKRVCEQHVPPPSLIRPGLPRWFDRLVLKLLAKDPADRFSSARAAAKVMEGCLAHMQDPSAAIPVEVADPPFPLRKMIWWAVGLLVVCAAAVGVLPEVLARSGFGAKTKADETKIFEGVQVLNDADIEDAVIEAEMQILDQGIKDLEGSLKEVQTKTMEKRSP
jgi:tRNA A-37 threonylcarbamoyl transferase component Bud32